MGGIFYAVSLLVGVIKWGKKWPIGVAVGVVGEDGVTLKRKTKAKTKENSLKS